MSSAVIGKLAERYSQLYLNPYEEGAKEACHDAVCRGIAPEKNDLPHFSGDERDSLQTLETPAGPVEILTLYKREDFETFLRIMANHCGDQPIPATQGASTLDGIINWQKICAHREKFYEEQREQGVLFPDWNTEFRNFTAKKENYRDTLIILSIGPYSNIPAERLGLSSEEWIRRSHTLRTHHECTHVICRRLYPEQINTVWDELVADAIGLYAAFGRYIRGYEETFLGVEDGRYTGGRLENYMKADEKKEPDLLAKKVSAVLQAFEQLFSEEGNTDPFTMIPILEKLQDRLWGRDQA